MIDIEELKNKFERHITNKKLTENLTGLKKELLSSDEEEFLEYHYYLATNDSINEENRIILKTYFYTRKDNTRDPSKVGNFLLNKYKTEENIQNKADIIKTLGHLKLTISKELAISEITSDEEEIRFASILVLGLLGNVKDIPLLNEYMLNDPSPKLRNFSTLSLRQIWFKYKAAKTEILELIYNAIQKEEELEPLSGMLITAQSLTNKKLGITETQYGGGVTGDIEKAKEKTLTELERLVKY